MHRFLKFLLNKKKLWPPDLSLIAATIVSSISCAYEFRIEESDKGQVALGSDGKERKEDNHVASRRVSVTPGSRKYIFKPIWRVEKYIKKWICEDIFFLVFRQRVPDLEPV